VIEVRGLSNHSCLYRNTSGFFPSVNKNRQTDLSSSCLGTPRKRALRSKWSKGTLNLLKKSNNQNGWPGIKQSKSHKYHFPIPLVFRIKTIKIPEKSREMGNTDTTTDPDPPRPYLGSRPLARPRDPRRRRRGLGIVTACSSGSRATFASSSRLSPCIGSS